MLNFKNFIYKSITFVLIMSLNSCDSFYNEEYKKPKLVDSVISTYGKELHKKVFYTAKKGFAIGHQDDTAYGIGWNYNDNPETIKSDVNEIIGDFPAVFGFDIGHLELGHTMNLDSVAFSTMRTLIIDAHNKGAIITLSWHPDNPSSGGSTWDKTPAVADIIKGGQHREKYELWVSKVADFFKSIEVNGELVPIVFRPFHEMNGSWFWWGNGNCTPQEYKTLWQETVQLLRDKHNLHNLLYAYSPNIVNSKDEYLKFYPGDDYVDILGFDGYDFKNSEGYKESVINGLNIVKSVATEKQKLYAFTETGYEKTDPNWYSEELYPLIKDTGIAWVLFWRNARKNHHFLPYKGQLHEKDFIKFEQLPKTLFLKDLNNLKY